MNGPILKGVSSALPRAFSRQAAILKVVEEKTLGTRLTKFSRIWDSRSRAFGARDLHYKEGYRMVFVSICEHARRAVCLFLRARAVIKFVILLLYKIEIASGEQAVANTFYSGRVQPIFTKHDQKKLVKASKFLQKHDQNHVLTSGLQSHSLSASYNVKFKYTTVRRR